MIYLLYGDSAPLQIKYEELLNKIKGEFPGIKEQIFDCSQNEITSFFDVIASNSMFSPHELVILKRAEEYKNLVDIAKSLKLYNLSQKDIIIVYEEFLNDYGKPTNEIGKKILNAFEDIAEIICYRKENEKNMTALYIQDSLNISSSEAQDLIDLVGDDFFKIKNEIAKIQNFLDGERYSLTKVKPILSLNQENNLKKLIEVFLISHENENLIEYIRQEKIYSLFIYSISEELMLLQKLLILIKEGKFNKNTSYNTFKDKIYEDIKQYFTNDRGFLHPYVIFLKIKNAQTFELDLVNEKLEDLLNLEYNIKTGNCDIDIETEAFILNFFNKK